MWNEVFKVIQLISGRARTQIKHCQVQWPFLCAYLHFSSAFNKIINFLLLETLSSLGLQILYLLVYFILIKSYYHLASSVESTSFIWLTSYRVSQTQARAIWNLSLFLDDLIHSHGLEYHPFIDNSQIYLYLAMTFVSFRFDYLSTLFLGISTYISQKHYKFNVSREKD